MNWLDVIGTVFMLGVMGAALFVVVAVVVHMVRIGRAGYGVVKRVSERRRFIATEDTDGRLLRYRINVPGSQKFTPHAYNALYTYLRARAGKDAPNHLVYKDGAWDEARKG